MFAVLGVYVFRELGAPGGDLNSQANFKNFGTALLTLFRCSMGEDWDLIFRELVWFRCAGPTRLYNPEQCSTVVPATFFAVFLVVQVFVVMNLFVSVTIDSFTTVVAAEFSELAMEHTSQWIACWERACEFDPTTAQSFIHVRQLEAFLLEVGS